MSKVSFVSNERKKVTYEEYKEAKDFAPTGCLLLDLAVGGGIGLGFPYGWMVNIVGDKSSGKTLLAWELLAANYYKYSNQLKFNYDGSEFGNSFDTEALYGVDFLSHKNHFGKTSDLVEEFNGNTSLFLKEIRSVNQRGIYIEDSLDGLSDADKEELEKKFEKMAETGKEQNTGSMNVGTASHLSKQFFRTKAGKLAKKKALLLIISQVRENLNAGLFGKKFYRAGGKAMDFFAHTCLWLYTVQKIKRNGKTIGVVIKAVAEKNKTARPFRECVFTMYFDYGIDNIGSCLDYLFDLRGKDGDLTKAANEIPWGNNGVTKSWATVQQWLKETGEYETAKEIKKEETGKANLSLQWVEEYIENSPKLKKKAVEYFGETVDRDTLIRKIEESPSMYEELERRVIDRWEQEEYDSRIIRRRKYS